MDGLQRDISGRRTVAAVFRERAAVDRAVDELTAAGFAPGDVSIAAREELASGGAVATAGAIVTVAAGDRVTDALAILERNGAETLPRSIGHRAEIAPAAPEQAVDDDVGEPPGPAAAPAGGALAGAVAGATLGTVVAGPLGTLVGGLAGAAAGGAAGEAVKQQSQSQDDPNG